jgi:hypothetical protein
MSRVYRVLISTPNQTVALDWALEFGAAPGNLPAFRDVAHPEFVVRTIQSIMDEMDGLFRIQGAAEQEAQQQYTIESFFAKDHRALNVGLRRDYLLVIASLYHDDIYRFWRDGRWVVITARAKEKEKCRQSGRVFGAAFSAWR